jgi:hypothetical protein
MRLATLLGILVSVVFVGVTIASAANLVTNGDFESGNVDFSTGYSYVASGVSQSPGTYGIRTLSTNFNPGYNTFDDHTSGTGNMMLVDGYDPGTIVWSESISVAQNTNYTFAAWATSSDNANLPTLRFSINSTQVGSDLSLPGVSTGADWVQFTSPWNSGLSTSATLVIIDTNSNYDASGDDFALDDISLVPEPSTLALLTIGSLGLFARRRFV